MWTFIKNLTGMEKAVIVAIVFFLGLAMIGGVAQVNENNKLLELCLQERPTQEYQCRAEAAARTIEQQRNTAIILNGSGSTR